jgi:nicotinamide mononucleotide transporter
LLIVVVGFVLLSFLLKQYTPSTVPYWDAWVSATAWAGMWLLAKRKIENWILLNVSNAFAIPLLLHKQLPLYAGLTLFLFIVAVFGYIKWNKILRTEFKSQNSEDRMENTEYSI